jgi:hypothetical protein
MSDMSRYELSAILARHCRPTDYHWYLSQYNSSTYIKCQMPPMRLYIGHGHNTREDQIEIIAHRKSEFITPTS